MPEVILTTAEPDTKAQFSYAEQVAVIDRITAIDDELKTDITISQYVSLLREKNHLRTCLMRFRRWL